MQKLIFILVFEKNANFLAENCRKSQKIVIITSVPVHPFRQGCQMVCFDMYQKYQIG
jgi:hypothetical protein